MINLTNFVFHYPFSDEKAVAASALNITAGECIVLCGKSGSGKTTFTRLINGLIPEVYEGEWSGSFRTDTLELGKSQIEDYASIVGSVFQNPNTQFFHINSTKEIAFPCENAGIEPAEIFKKIDIVSTNLELQNLLDRNLFELSGGERQKVALGAAAIHEPKIVVLDEPTGNLDADAIAMVAYTIRQLKAKGITVVVAEHRLEYLNGIADRYCYFEEGELRTVYSQEDFLALSNEQLHQKGLRSTDLEPYKKAVQELIGSFDFTTESLLAGEELAIGYKKQEVLKEIPSFSIDEPMIIGIMGANGVGKTTFIKALSGLLKFKHGQVYWKGKPQTAKQMLKRCFLVMQDVHYQLFSESVKNEILLGAQNPERYDEVIDLLDLRKLENRHPVSLSGGQQQRVLIAAAICSGKDILIFDEPTSGLDYTNMENVTKLMKQLKAMGKIIFVITHDQELAAKSCDKIMHF
ncbi:MAG: energy-coupling factor ABC transporter ATP-binding protein [Carnobacterium sp.]|uniref:ABC transporter ATP-binding protein n=1 Tax=Carnobacterium sp. TaxID=48221 RepID=UPI002FC88987